jgi:hypothetical protein
MTNLALNYALRLRETLDEPNKIAYLWLVRDEEVPPFKSWRPDHHPDRHSIG